MGANPLPPLLVVDDDFDARFILQWHIRRAGVDNRIDNADCGGNAIAYLDQCLAGNREWPCIIFLDVDMPDVNGFDVLAWARVKGIPAKTLIVMRSASQDRECVKRAFREGAHAFLVKTDPAETTRELVRTAIAPAPHDETINALSRFHPPW